MVLRSMGAKAIIEQLLTEAKVMADYRTQKDHYIVIPVYLSSSGPNKIEGNYVFVDGDQTETSWSNLDSKWDDGPGKVWYDPIKTHTSFRGDKPEPVWYRHVLNRGGAIDVNHATKMVNVNMERLNQHKHRRPDHKSMRTHSYTIAGPNGDFNANSLILRKMLKLIVQQDPAVATFTFEGTDTLKGTVQDALGRPDQAQTVLQKTSGELILYHGTSVVRAKAILKNGLTFGKNNGLPSDLARGYSERNIYLTPNKEEARNYASRAAIHDRSAGAVLQVIVRDFTKIVPDEDTMNWMKYAKARKHYDQVAKNVPELQLKSGGVADDTHFRHWDWSKASPELKRLLVLWSMDAKSYRGAIAYRGSIPAKDIKLIQTYKPVKMARDPDEDEYDAAMAKTQATLKNYPA